MNSEQQMRGFDESLPMALLRARESTMRLFRPMLAEHDLTEQQWRVIRALAANDLPMDVGEIAEATFLLGPSLSRILANLTDRGLLIRNPAPDDQRRSVVQLSSAGHELFSVIAPDSEERYAQLEASFGVERLNDLLALLRELEKS